jgi:predicted metal-dependent peptidase
VLRRALESLAIGRHLAKKTCPYFSSVLLKFVLRASPGLGTVACSPEGLFFYDPAVVATWSPKQMAGAWLHETLHIWNRHAKRRGERDAKAWNEAADRAINPAVLEVGLQLPLGGGLHPKDIGMRNGLTADEYYRAPEGPKGSGGDGSKGSGLGHGSCGGCAGNPLPCEAGSKDDPGARSEAELARAAKAASEAIVAAAGEGRGKIPADWVRAAEASLEPPRVRWEEQLAVLVRQAVAYRPGASQHRYDAPSRRQGGVGYGVGRPLLPRLRTPVPRVFVALDTSGSMGGKDLTDALRETRGVLRAVGAEATFCACDARVHTLAKVRTVDEAAALVKGGGGTDFRPVFEALSRERPGPDVVVFFTDGHGPAPEAPPVGVAVVWVLVGSYGVRRPAPWGTCLAVHEGHREIAEGPYDGTY